MAIEFSCPSGHALSLPDEYAGLLAECPLCGARVRAPGGSALPAVLLPDDAPAGSAARHALSDEHDTVGLDARGLPVTSGEEKLALRHTRTGISYHWAGVLVVIFGFIFCVLASGVIYIVHLQDVLEKEMKLQEQAALQNQQPPPAIWFGRKPKRNAPAQPFGQPLNPNFEAEVKERLTKAQPQVELLFSAYGGIVALLGLIGSWYLLAVPKTSRATGLIGLSLVMDLIHLGSSWLNEIFFGEKNGALALVSVAALALAFVLFILFLHRLAYFLGLPALAKEATGHLRSWSRLISGGIFFGVAFVLFAQANPQAAALLFLVGLVLFAVLWLLWILRYLRLLSDMRKAIDARLAG